MVFGKKLYTFGRNQII